MKTTNVIAKLTALVRQVKGNGKIPCAAPPNSKIDPVADAWKLAL
jgi:hypothetical protein